MDNESAEADRIVINLVVEADTCYDWKRESRDFAGRLDADEGADAGACGSDRTRARQEAADGETA